MELRIDDIQISMAASLARAHCRPVQCRAWCYQALDHFIPLIAAGA